MGVGNSRSAGRGHNRGQGNGSRHAHTYGHGRAKAIDMGSSLAIVVLAMGGRDNLEEQFKSKKPTTPCWNGESGRGERMQSDPCLQAGRNVQTGVGEDHAQHGGRGSP